MSTYRATPTDSTRVGCRIEDEKAGMGYIFAPSAQRYLWTADSWRNTSKIINTAFLQLDMKLLDSAAVVVLIVQGQIPGLNYIYGVLHDLRLTLAIQFVGLVEALVGWASSCFPS